MLRQVHVHLCYGEAASLACNALATSTAFPREENYQACRAADVTFSLQRLTRGVYISPVCYRSSRAWKHIYGSQAVRLGILRPSLRFQSCETAAASARHLAGRSTSRLAASEAARAPAVLFFAATVGPPAPRRTAGTAA